MCFSSNAIEYQSLLLAQRIRKNTIYKLIHIDTIGNDRLDPSLLDENHFHDLLGAEAPLIKTIILEGYMGKYYEVKPSESGLRFASGEITYEEYRSLERNGNKMLLTLTTGLLSMFVLFGWTFIHHFF